MRSLFKDHFKFLTFVLLVIFLTLGFSIAVQSLAWAPPISPPPDNNVPPPINVGDNLQGKEGALGLNIAGSYITGLYVTSDDTVVTPVVPSSLVHLFQFGSDPAFRVDDMLNDITPFIIDEDGDVGIGTPSPADGAKLHVYTTDNGSSDILKLESEIDGINEYSGIQFRANSRDIFSRIAGVLGPIDNNDLGIGFWNWVSGASNPSEVMRITGDKVGIGTANPNKQLHIKTASGNAEIDIQSGSENYWAIYHDESSEDLRFWNSDVPGNGNALTIKNNGNVGIGEYLYHDGDSDTYTRYTNDRIRFRAGDRDFIDLYEGTDPDLLVINDGGNNIDMRIKGDSDANLLFTDASTDRVGIGTADPVEKLEVVGAGFIKPDSIWSSGDIAYLYLGAVDHYLAAQYGDKDILKSYDGWQFDTSGGAKMVLEQDGDVGIGTTDPGGKFHVVVGGGVSGSLTDDFETGVISSNWTQFSTDNNNPSPPSPGRIQVSSSNGPRGSYHILMDSSINGDYEVECLVTNINMSGATQVSLSFYMKEFGDEGDDCGASFVGLNNARDCVAFTCDGSTYFELVDLQSPDPPDDYGAPNPYSEDLHTHADWCGTADSNFAIAFCHYDNYPLTNDGFAYDDITINYSGGGGGGSTALLVTDSGDVGIGTAVPQGTLDVNGDICIAGDCKDSWTTAGGSSGWTDDGGVIRLTDSNDQVGVGTASPSAGTKLHIKTSDMDNQDILKIETAINSNNEYMGIQFKATTPDIFSRIAGVLGPTVNDLGIGFWNNISGTLHEAMRITNNRVGIGITNPDYLLHITDDGSVAIFNIDNTGTDLWTGTRLARDGDEKWFVGMNSSDDKLRFRRDGDGSPSDDMVIDTSGYVGIGDTSPDYPLDLENKTIGGINNLIIADTGASEGIDWGDQEISVYTASQGGYNAFVFDSTSAYPFVFLDSNVGIGAANPGVKLEVNGQAMFGSATEAVASGENLIYGNMDTNSDGNLLLLQKESSDLFTIDKDGNVVLQDAKSIIVKKTLVGDSGIFLANYDDGKGRFCYENDSLNSPACGDPRHSAGIFVEGSVKASEFCLGDTSCKSDWFAIAEDNDWTGAGTGAMYAADSNDTVGIGTDNPSTETKLHIFTGDMDSQDVLKIETDINSNNEYMGIQFKATTQDIFSRIAGVLGSTDNNDLGIGFWNWASGASNLSEVMRITGNKVGIGTADPNKQLHVYDTSGNAEIDIQSVAGTDNHWAIYHDSVSDSLKFWKFDEGRCGDINNPCQNRMVITEGGSVGIGTDNPVGALEVYSSKIGETPSDPVAAMLSQTGLTLYGEWPDSVVDGITTEDAWDTDNASAGAYLKIDLGAGNEKAYTEARIYTSPGAYTRTYNIQYSSDDISYTTIQTINPLPGDWTIATWANAVAYRYWRFELTGAAVDESGLTELEMYVGAAKDDLTLALVTITQFNLTTYGDRDGGLDRVVDDNDTQYAWSTDYSSVDHELRIDFGALKEKEIIRVKIYASQAGYNGTYAIEYSDDGLSYTQVQAPGPIFITPSVQDWNEVSWAKDVTGKYQYWRLRLTNTPGHGPVLTELEMDASTPASSLLVNNDGTVDIAGSMVTIIGDLTIGGDLIMQGGDLAEAFAVEGKVEPGDVLVIKQEKNNRLEKSNKPYDQSVVGVISADPAIKLGDREETQVAMSGTVLVKVCDQGGEIKAGDMLTTSSVPGMAMKCMDLEKCFGATIGKALESFSGKYGMIKMLVGLQ